MPRATIKRNCLPVGAYTCTFEGVQETHHEQYGEGWKWMFEVSEGPHQRGLALRITNTGDNATPGNSCGRFFGMLAGKPPEDGMEVDTDDYVGDTFQVVVGQSPKPESTRVESFVAVEGGKATDSPAWQKGLLARIRG